MRCPDPRNKKSEKFSRKNQITTLVRLHLQRKHIASKALNQVKSAEKYRKLKDKIKEREIELSKSFYKRKIYQENRAIHKMIENLKYFYSYMKSKTKGKSKIEPFVDKKGNVLKENLAQTLQTQYSNIWSHSNPENKILDYDEFLREEEGQDDVTISDVFFSNERIRKVINKVRITQPQDLMGFLQ